MSSDLPLEYSVPQGSILGPTLFLVYINDLCSLNIPNCKIISFADDMALVFSGDSWTNTFYHAQAGFDLVSHWLRVNVLTLNVE